jgi:hypothetical protein
MHDERSFAELDPAEQHAVSRATLRGAAVADPELAPVAVRHARSQQRRFVWLALGSVPLIGLAMLLAAWLVTGHLALDRYATLILATVPLVTLPLLTVSFTYREAARRNASGHDQP